MKTVLHTLLNKRTQGWQYNNTMSQDQEHMPFYSQITLTNTRLFNWTIPIIL
jgi:hypothetical protein